ncbi:MAG: type II secretion system GspH family protein [Methyloprofundus sp.]|nr:type II secretion system GspH family protein [Methyloprofundus sp.]
MMYYPLFLARCSTNSEPTSSAPVGWVSTQQSRIVGLKPDLRSYFVCWFPRSSVGTHTESKCSDKTHAAMEVPVCNEQPVGWGKVRTPTSLPSDPIPRWGSSFTPTYIVRQCQAGFTLLEMVLVLFLVGLMASATLMLTESVEDQAKYDETKRRMDMMRKAIVGDPTRTINGSPEISGFVADMGRLPNDVRELTEQAYCLTSGYATKADCTTAGKTWHEQASYVVFELCSDPSYTEQTACEGAGETWDANNANMAVGWNGPYLQVMPERDGSLMFRDGYGNTGDTTEQATSDARNAGWKISIAPPDISVASEGFDASVITDDIQSAIINASDWRVDLSGTSISAAFIKPYDPSLLTHSRCSDPTKTTKASCTSPATWFGGCNKAGYFNKTSCQTDSGAWDLCSDATSADKNACETASKIWYGEGYGCAEQKYTTKAYCEGALGAAADTWRSCTDDGTLADKASCEAANEIWYGDDIFSIPLANYRDSTICMKLFYRLNEAIEVVIGDKDGTGTIGVTIKEDGSHQTITFTFPDDTFIPIGVNKMGIYKHEGANCTSEPYPNDRTMIDVVVHARTQLGVINW